MFCRKNTPILNHLRQNRKNVLAIQGVGEENSGTSMLPASAILEINIAALALLVIWNTIFEWEIAKLDC